MTREDISFKTSDGVTLRGWFYRHNTSSTIPLPCLVMSHGFSAVKEMSLGNYASHFINHLSLNILVYDHRGWGASDTLPGQPRQELIASIQCSDMSDAITYAQSRKEVNQEKIGIWGSSYSGGHVLWVGAVDKRVKAVVSQLAMVNGWENLNRLVRADMVAQFNAGFQADRLGRAAGQAPMVLPIVSSDPNQPGALPTAESFEFFETCEGRSFWKNEVTMKSMEDLRSYCPSLHINRISPTPLLMTVAEKDTLCPIDISLEAYSRALEPKELQIVPGGHFEGYAGPKFDLIVERQTAFLKKTICA
ncbi:DltD N-terminal domain protein [Stipitochalara longipes BDJ]|nr:DltD N-terminal domain protein [Stipitochalara longipes BDJ]